MNIPIPIPIGSRHFACARGRFWKIVQCENCGVMFGYQLDLESTGVVYDLLFLDGKGSGERALEQAQKRLRSMSQNIVVPVPCPNCGHYQHAMAAQLKEEASMNLKQVVGFVLFAIGLACFLLRSPYAWILAALNAVAGTVMISWGYWESFRYDPNSGDPKSRIELGRKSCLWGDELSESLAKSMSSQPDARKSES